MDFDQIVKYEPQNEAELVSLTKSLECQGQISLLVAYWLIGHSIIKFYKKHYGQQELQNLAAQTGIGIDTPHKACKFARQYRRCAPGL
ncbi:MAG: hypothetical protein PHO01_11665 [Desulfotomaculaceae bacterium]|nr:hypothetical protein [Desulfotomaculaceae bacterium]